MHCTDKVAYATLRAAADAAVEQLNVHDRTQRVYACDRCCRYHLTTQPLGRQGTITADMVRALAASVGASNRNGGH